MLGKNRRHTLTLVQVLARRWRQKLHRHLRADLALAHLLLDRFWKQFDQSQPPRYPTHAAVELPRQFLQAIAEALLHLRQQPPHFQRGLMFGKA